MKSIATISVILALAAPMLSSASENPWPKGAIEKDDPRVLAFYERVCNQWADKNGMADELRKAYLEKCKSEAPSIFPVGYAEDAAGDG
ncbi:MAG: hypothetical protein H6964_03330 [Chromatiaceae bacterium]|nr:hypothetical protein [Gammaproteobacteria bacterium]MCB1873975.1 hypothetical protein [Gammaproteobacteria bacterium]MCP5427716.1 hypothetical protein [Chromatiaceae bacterium]MCP5446013.1 hypothetical protein [Chromatiaceae bacterium]